MLFLLISSFNLLFSMEETIIAVAYLIGAILGILLLIKVWRACDDIRRIANKFDPEAMSDQERYEWFAKRNKPNRPRPSVEAKEELEK